MHPTFKISEYVPRYVCTWLNEFVVNPPLIETFKEERGRGVRGGEQRLNALLRRR